MDMQIPFLVDKDGQAVATSVELALCLAAVRADAPKGLSFFKGNDDKVEMLAKIGWPLMLRRTPFGYLALDTVGILGEGVLLQCDPQQRAVAIALSRQGDFVQGALALAKQNACSGQFQHNFSCLLDIREIAQALGEGRGGATEAYLTPVAPAHASQAEEEARLILAWIASLRDAGDQLDGMLPDLTEALEKRMLILEEERQLALKPLQEQLSQLRPRIDAEIKALEDEHRRESERLDAQLTRDTESWQAYLKQVQAGEREYQNSIGELADYYHDQARLAQEEIKSLGSEHTRQGKELLQQMSGQIGVARRPLAAMEQRIAMTNRYWDVAADREKSLVAAVMQVLQQAAQERRSVAHNLEGMALQLEQDLGDQTMITIPFYLARYPGKSPRYSVIAPSSLQPKGQLASLLSGVVGNVALPMEARTGAWEMMAQRIEDLLQSGDLPAPIWDALNQGNLIGKAEVTAQALQGLEQMVKDGVLKSKQAEQLKARIE